MVMEFCSKGSLSDAVDRGWLRKRGAPFEPDYQVRAAHAGNPCMAILILLCCCCCWISAAFVVFVEVASHAVAAC